MMRNKSGAELRGLQNPLHSKRMSQLIPVFVLILISIIASCLSPVFFSVANIRNLSVQIAVTMVVSLGMMCCELTGGIDLSVGSMVALCGAVAAGLMPSMPVGLAILAAILVGGGLGTVSGLIISKVRIAPFVVTLGMMNIARGLVYWYTNARSIIWSPFPGAEVMTFIGAKNIFGIPVLAIIWVIICIIMAFILRFTVVGRIIYSIGGNEDAVRICGIDVTRWKAMPYIIAGICSGIGGVLMTARLGVGSPMIGEGLELDCIAATVVGGTSPAGGVGTVGGMIIGVLILGVINNILDLLNVASYPQMIFKGVIIISAVILASKKKD